MGPTANSDGRMLISHLGTDYKAVSQWLPTGRFQGFAAAICRTGYGVMQTIFRVKYSEKKSDPRGGMPIPLLTPSRLTQSKGIHTHQQRYFDR